MSWQRGMSSPIFLPDLAALLPSHFKASSNPRSSPHKSSNTFGFPSKSVIFLSICEPTCRETRRHTMRRRCSKKTTASHVASWVCHFSKHLAGSTNFYAGSTALTGLGFYTYYSGMSQLRAQRQAIQLSKSKYKYSSRQLGILSISATFVGLGIYRMLN
jgi:hypothetical protein